MSQPVRLSDGLVCDARVAGELLERSIAGQVEFWARLGRALELLMQGAQALALSRAGTAEPLLSCLNSVGSPKGQKRLKEGVKSQPYPHYEPAPNKPGFFIRTTANGKCTLGRFVNREFKAVKAEPPLPR